MNIEHTLSGDKRSKCHMFTCRAAKSALMQDLELLNLIGSIDRRWGLKTEKFGRNYLRPISQQKQ